MSSRDSYLVGTLVLGSRQGLAYDDADEADEDAATEQGLATAIARATLASVPNAEGGRTVDGGGPPQSFAPPSKPQQQRNLPSAIEGIPNEAWTQFVLAMRTALPGAVSASNSLGMFEMRPRRLADLRQSELVNVAPQLAPESAFGKLLGGSDRALIENLRGTRAATGRMVWVGEWSKPLSQKMFLESPELQYRAFAASMVKYIDGLRDGAIDQPEEGVDDDMSLAGALAILHRCGPRGLVSWGASETDGSRFNDTQELYSKTNGIF